MSRKPKPKNTLSAGQRALIYEEELKQKLNLQKEIQSAETVSDKPEEPPKQSEKPKEKLQSVTVKVDFSLDVQKKSSIHGMCGGPLSMDSDISHIFSRLKTPWIKPDSKSGCINLSKIFPNFSADEHNEENYDFSECDKYVLAAANSGAKIILPLGEIHSLRYLRKMLESSENYGKICNICVNIIKHYNNYFADGFALGIKHFEILPQTDSPEILQYIKREEIFELYERISSGIKHYDGNLKVGGMCFSDCSAYFRDFIKFLQKRNILLDFVSMSVFSDNVQTMRSEIEKYLKLLKNSQYSNTKLIISSWGYLPNKISIAKSKRADDAKERREFFENRSSVLGASFVVCGLLCMEEFPDIEVSCMYSGEPGNMWCSLCDEYGIEKKVYYGLDAYSKYAMGDNAVFCRVEEKEGFLHSGVYAAASLGKGDRYDEAYILIASHNGCMNVDLRAEHIPDTYCNADIYMLDGVKNMESPYTVELSGMRKRMVLSISRDSVVFIKLY